MRRVQQVEQRIILRAVVALAATASLIGCNGSNDSAASKVEKVRAKYEAPILRHGTDFASKIGPAEFSALEQLPPTAATHEVLEVAEVHASAFVERSDVTLWPWQRPTVATWAGSTLDPVTISYIRQLFVEGLTRSAICRRLVAEDVPTGQGGRWHPATIGRVLAREAVAT